MILLRSRPRLIVNQGRRSIDILVRTRTFRFYTLMKNKKKKIWGCTQSAYNFHKTMNRFRPNNFRCKSSRNQLEHNFGLTNN